MPLLLRIAAPSFKNKDPTFARTAPALPSQPVDVSILVSAFIVNKGVVMRDSPRVTGREVRDSHQGIAGRISDRVELGKDLHQIAWGLALPLAPYEARHSQ